MRARGPRRLATLAATAGAALLVAVPGALPAPAATYDLSGTWTSDEPKARGGTTLRITQEGSRVTWIGGPNDGAWVQKFNGTLAGADVSGVFKQDAPGVQPPRYGGTITFGVQDSCHFRTKSVRQPGQPDAGGALFTKTPCTIRTPRASRLELVLFRKQYRASPRFAAFCPSSFECVVRNGATVTICNKDDFNHRPFSLTRSNTFGGLGRAALKPGKCLTLRAENRSTVPLLVRLYDDIHSQERFIVTVVP
jgi:hypothetical protein